MGRNKRAFAIYKFFHEKKYEPVNQLFLSRIPKSRFLIKSNEIKLYYVLRYFIYNYINIKNRGYSLSLYK